MAKITLSNSRDLNARGNGTQTTQQIAYAHEEYARWYWISECPTAIDVGDRLPHGTYLAKDRHAQQRVRLSISRGDLIREYTSTLRSGVKDGPASVRIDMFSGLAPDPEGKFMAVWMETPNVPEAAIAAARKELAGAPAASQ